jgi:hypothetical protein
VLDKRRKSLLSKDVCHSMPQMRSTTWAIFLSKETCQFQEQRTYQTKIKEEGILPSKDQGFVIVFYSKEENLENVGRKN